MSMVTLDAESDVVMARPQRREAAGEEEEVRQYYYSQQHKSQSKIQLTTVREQSELNQAELAALMAQSDDLAVKVEGNPNVYDQIEADRESRAEPKKKAVPLRLARCIGGSNRRPSTTLRGACRPRVHPLLNLRPRQPRTW